MSDCLKLEHLKKALRRLENPRPIDRRIPVNPLVWNDYIKAFKLTEKQMKVLFVKTEYIGMNKIKEVK